MDNNQNNNQFQSTSSVPAGAPDNRGQVNQDGQKSGNLPAVHSPATVLGALAVVILALVAVFAVLFTQNSAPPQSLGVDKNGVSIINLNKKQVAERVANAEPLSEPEVHAVFRWAAENPEEAASLSAEEKANIIRALNQ